MTIKELMVGDLLKANNDVFWIKKDMIVEITKIVGTKYFDEDEYVYCRLFGYSKYQGLIICNDLDPIPLTEEILEKNFPNPTDGLSWFPEEGGFNCHTYVPNCEINAFGLFKYVHELQHALRLCGIEKEIELK